LSIRSSYLAAVSLRAAISVLLTLLQKQKASLCLGPKFLPTKSQARWHAAMTDHEMEMIRRAGQWKPIFPGAWIFPKGGFRVESERPSLWERILARLVDGAVWMDFKNRGTHSGGGR
jgi:hypothetical protein